MELMQKIVTKVTRENHHDDKMVHLCSDNVLHYVGAVVDIHLGVRDVIVFLSFIRQVLNRKACFLSSESKHSLERLSEQQL